MNIINLTENPNKPDIFYKYNVESRHVLVIDNGSFKCRAGWSNSEKPILDFRNFILKPRRDRRKEVAEPLINKYTQIGNAITNLESVRLNLKTQFDRNVVTHFHNQEQIFDYIFAHLGVNNEEKFTHPVLLTEALGNPNYFRQQMNELLFECYGIPSVCYGIDSLFSMRHNAVGTDTLIISFGYNTTHVIPVLDGQIRIENVRRLNLGGYHIIHYLHRLMQMKYPMHINAITISKIETLLHCHSSIALDYLEELRRWSDIDYYTENVKKIQLAFVMPTTQSTPQNQDQKIEKRKELTRRLIEINARRAKSKQLDMENQLRFMSSVRELYEIGEMVEFEAALKQNDIENLVALDKTISSLRARLHQMETSTQDSSLGANQTKPKEKPSNNKKPPADVPLEKWVSEINFKRDEILGRKEARKARRQEAAKRHTAAAQERMRIISLLAHNDKGIDNFGVNDNDWDVYKSINKDNESDSESDNEKLLEYETILSKHDPSFKQNATQGSDVAENYQLHFSVESIRAPEILFQPSLIGCPEMGVAELIDFVLKLFPAGEQQRLVNGILLTGGCSQFAGLKERLSKELLEMRPFKTPFNIYAAPSPEIDAWLGAKEFANSNEFNNSLTLKTDYIEKGSDYFKEHLYSNRYYANA